MKYKSIISSAEIPVVTESDTQELLNKILKNEFLAQYIPKFSFWNAKISPEIPHVYLKEKGPLFKLTYPSCYINAQKLSVKDSISILEYFFERARGEQKIDCLHGSAVIWKDVGVVFWGGASGMGKTRLALSFEKEHKATLVADEKVLINFTTEKLVGGIECVYPSKDATQGFKNFKPLNNSKKIIFVHTYVENDNAPLVCEQWSVEKADWHLYEECSRKIRGVSRRIENFSIPLPSLDTQELAFDRSKRIRTYLESNPVFYIRGSEKNIIEKIKSIIHGSK